MKKILSILAVLLCTLPIVAQTAHTIGEHYGGGIVFYVYDNGQHGLIAATIDQSTKCRWFGGTNTAKPIKPEKRKR